RVNLGACRYRLERRAWRGGPAGLAVRDEMAVARGFRRLRRDFERLLRLVRQHRGDRPGAAPAPWGVDSRDPHMGDRVLRPTYLAAVLHHHLDGGARVRQRRTRE